MSRDLVEELRAVAVSEGADAVGVTSAAPLEQARVIIEERKAAGLHGGMHFTYGRPERSTDPRRILPDAQSIVVALRRYQTDDSGSPASHDGHVLTQEAPVPSIARYVHADEYGRLEVALEAMARELERRGHSAVVVMDDNRLVDRAVAFEAGLGWFGRNTMLLHPELGSWTVIGSVVTSAPLLATERRVDDGCGGCHRCQVECPTGAIDESGVLDANRCLAWLLQDTGRFPMHLRAALGARLYGCDDCQEVCPVNDRGLVGGSVAVEITAVPRPLVPDVVSLLELSDDELMERHGHWYIPRRRAEYLRRNVLMVFANVVDSDTAQTPRATQVLRESLSSPSAIVRSSALWAADRTGRHDLFEQAAAHAELTANDPEGHVAQELAEIDRLTSPGARG